MSARRSSRATTTSTSTAAASDPAAPDDQAGPQVSQADQATLFAQMSAFLAQQQAIQNRTENTDNEQREAINAVEANVQRRFTMQTREAEFTTAQATFDRRGFNIGANNATNFLLTKFLLRMKHCYEDIQAIIRVIERALDPDVYASFPAVPLLNDLSKAVKSEQLKSQAEIERVRLADRFKGTHSRLPAVRERFIDGWNARIHNRPEWNDAILAEDLTWLAREAKDLQNHLDSATMLDSVANQKKRNNDGNRGGRNTRGRGVRNNRGGTGRGRGNGNRQAATAGAEAVVGE